MERANKKFLIISILIITLFINGCDKVNLKFNGTDNNVENNQEANTNITNDDDSNNKTSVNSNTLKEADPKPTDIQPVANTQIPIYSINSESGEIETVTAMVPADEEITPLIIVDLVVEAMADQSLTVGVESVTTKDNTVIVSFYSNQPPVSNIGAGIEVSILDAIAQSLIDNLDEYNNVIYRTEGKAYSSGHIELGIDEVYLGNN